MSLFHINTCSLSKNIEEHEYLLDKTKIDFDVIGISESRIKKNKSPVNRVNLKDCSCEPCPTESQVALCDTLVIIFPTNLEVIYDVYADLQN